MRTLVHLSDLHFGRIDQRLIQPLVGVMKQLQPDLIAVSGDLTQRARPEQFQAARIFLQALPFPQIIVPGNHDIPLYNVWARFLQGLARYRLHLTADLSPFYADEEILVLGLNTARAFAFKGGRINVTQLAYAEARLRAFTDDVIKVIVTHHPFDLPERYGMRALVGRARLAMERLTRCRVDVFLAGHLHLSHAIPATLRFKPQGHSAILIQAGTATSTRGRGEANAFNVIRIQNPEITVERYSWQPEAQVFIVTRVDTFRRSATGWQPLSDPSPTIEVSSS